MRVSSALKYLMICFHVYLTIGLYSEALSYSDQTIHIPITGFDFLALPKILFLLSWLTLLSALFSFIGRFQSTATILCGVAGFLFQIATSESRYAFSYFPPFALMAFGISERQKNSNGLVIFLSSVYVTAALHKALLFSKMSRGLPTYIRKLVAGVWSTENYFLLEPLTNIMASSLILVELFIGVSFFFRRTRLMAFAVAVVFHASINIVAGGMTLLSWVGVLLLATHAATASLDANLQWKQLLRSRPVLAALGISTFALIADFFFPSPSLWHGLFSSLYLYSLLITISALGFRQSKYQRYTLPIRSKSLFVFAIALVIWGLLPFLSKYSNPMLGWAMFTAAEKDQPTYVMEVQDVQCVQRLRLSPSFSMAPKDEKTVSLRTHQKSGMNLLRTRLLEICPEAQPSHIATEH